MGVNVALFSLTYLAGIDPALGIKMLSTGYVGCVAEGFELA
jgi:hypothetical protein